METDKRIQILLSTYNGEKYLREQLDSYTKLENFNQVKVLIRDDGSSDGTRKILKEYAQREEFEVEFGEHLGTSDSYQWLIQHSDSECGYFAFSDQDDVWLPHKLTLALEALKQYPQEEPLLFASRSQIVDENLHRIGYSSLPIRGISFYNAMVQNVLPGHTQVFNTALRNDLAVHGIHGAHVVDWWLYLVASAKGKIIFSEECSVLHRQHSGNAVGYRLGLLGRLKKKLSYIREGKGNAISHQLNAFFNAYEKELLSEYREEVLQYLEGLGTLSGRVSYLRHSRLYRQKRTEDFAFHVLYLFGKYNL